VHREVHAVARVTASTAIDLSGKRKVWFVVGRGGVGKTHLLRWAGELADQRGGETISAAIDPANRSWRLFREGVHEPDTTDPQSVAEWTADLLNHLMQPDTTASALIDTGGGDTSLALLVRTMPDLAAVLEDAGVVPVLVHVLGNNPQDLVPMAEIDDTGFRPAATMVVCNERFDRRNQFGRILRHDVFQAAINRGAQHVWMPYMTKSASELVDARRLPFLQAGNSIGPFNGAAVRGWLKAMGDEFAPVMSWLP
jgi:hypothetical protein